MKLIGREQELNRAALFLDRARRERVARILRITGSSGNGKTALCREIAERASGEWLSVYVAAHKIQGALPLVVARRLGEEIVRALGDDGALYASGLESALALSEADPKAFESALVRLIEGVLHDRALLVLLDDVQWADAESRALIPRILMSFADRPFVLAISERADESSDTAIDLSDEAIIVAELNGQSASQLARAMMPGASDDVIAAVVDHARGRPVDITTIASLSADYATMTPDDVAASARTIVARDVAALPASVREFLQICSLIGDPIDYGLLRALWPDETLLQFMEATSGRYIVQDDGLHFVHATVEQSILETIAIEIPYRKRIIAAIEAMRIKTPEHYELLVAQAHAMGDRTLEFQALTELANEARKRAAFPLLASALERAIRIAPGDADFLPLYEQLANTFNALTRDDAARIAREGLDRAAAAGVRAGTGQLVAALLFSLRHNSDLTDFNNTLARYESQLSEPADRAHLLAVRLYEAYCNNDRAAFEAHWQALRSLGVTSPVHEVRYATFSGVLHGRAGAFDEAQRSLHEARRLNEEHGLGNVMMTMISAGEGLTIFHTYGAGREDMRRAFASLHRHESTRFIFETLEMLALGAPGDAMERIEEAYVHQEAVFSRRLLLGLAGSIAALSSREIPAYLLDDLRAEAATPGNAPPLAPVLAAAAVLSSDTMEAARLARRAYGLARAPFELQIAWLPVVLVQAAARAGATDVVKAFAEAERAHDLYPWTQAQHRLAQLTARRALKYTVEPGAEAELASAFRELGAVHFADLALALGATSETPKSEKTATMLTRREREVAQHVADGKSNREIAESLVLSERTVEGHIANIFAKLNVGSRAQIAIWHVTSAH